MGPQAPGGQCRGAAARNLQITGQACQATVIESVRAYREGMRGLARLGPLDVWYDRIDVKQVLAIAAERRAEELRHALRETKIRQRTALRVPAQTNEGGERLVARIIHNPPLIVHENTEAFDVERVLTAYAASLPPDRRPLLERYTVVDAVRKVVGVGSVGTRCYLALLVDSDRRAPIFLQLKEAVQSALTRTVGRSQYEHQGMRVVVGQRLMQAASDIFLGVDKGDGARMHVTMLGQLRRDMQVSGDVFYVMQRHMASASYALRPRSTWWLGHPRQVRGTARRLAVIWVTGTPSTRRVRCLRPRLRRPDGTGLRGARRSGQDRQGRGQPSSLSCGAMNADG